MEYDDITAEDYAFDAEQDAIAIEDEARVVAAEAFAALVREEMSWQMGYLPSQRG